MGYVYPGCRCHYVSPLPWAVILLGFQPVLGPPMPYTNLQFHLNFGYPTQSLTAQNVVLYQFYGL